MGLDIIYTCIMIFISKYCGKSFEKSKVDLVIYICIYENML